MGSFDSGEEERLAIPQIILRSLAAGVIIGIALAFPGAGMLYKEFKKEEWERRKKRGTLRAVIKRLERQDFVSWKEKSGQRILTLTENGEKKLLQYDLESLSLKKQTNWDKKWRLVIFDIPENKKVAREYLRKKLKQLGLYQWQKSVFITPFECKDEIDFLRHTLEIDPFVQYISAHELPGLDVKFYRYFALET